MAREARIAALSCTPVKGLRIVRRRELAIGEDGARGDRRFYLVDQRLRMVNGKRFGALSEVTAELILNGAGDEAPVSARAEGERERLTLCLPDGRCVCEDVGYGDELETTFHSGPRLARIVLGPFADELSALVGEQLRLVRAADRASALDRGRRGAISVVSQASLARLGQAAGVDVDGRRFRMSIELDGLDAFEEDGWIGRRVRVGSDVVLQFHGHIGRCVVTSREPETGQVDIPTLDLLRDLRAGVQSAEPLPLGIYGEVQRTGSIVVGDPVELV
ncbi:MAG: MOSC domain-containing protein [Solirubrobacteraceae bacterium]